MAESFVLRGRDGEGANSSGVLPGKYEWLPGSYRLQYGKATFSAGTPPVVRIDRLDMNIKVGVPNGPVKEGVSINYNFIDNHMSTDLDLREGQSGDG